ncbi:MAG TPA: Gfo/Idh/MocA family oxidoreductase [Gemmatimonadaceae bacterium]|nr:Gfo/Idh/MocA family oxidoreductase [Gemmatimonadaceae bacterium]
MTEPKFPSLSRRAFVQATAAVTAGLVIPRGLRASPSADAIRVGVVGCGGRGTGAARDCMRGSDNVEIVALGDLFPDRLAACRTNLAKVVAENAALAPKYKVADERCFSGFDAYQKVLASGIDLVILATPPGFRPAHLAAAVAAGKHIFTEKPVAVDAAGIRSVLASADLATQKGLAVVAGTQRRHDAGYRATIERLHGGAIGEITGGQVYWNQGGLWNQPRKPEWTDAEWQIRNWLYFTWLSGDHIVEQHVHNIDVANWVMGAHPVRAVGVGGRQRRTGPEFGHIYDHFAIEFEYPSGARVLSMCRQIDGSANQVGERFTGTRGTSDAHGTIEGASPWKLDGKGAPNPYVQEHTDLVASIRAGAPLNELRQVAESTLTAIMGREAAYTGQVIAWDELLNASQDITPPALAFGPLPVPRVAMPGQTKVNRAWNEA